MTTTALRAVAWRVPVLWRAAGGCLYPGAIVAALAIPAALAERLA